MAATPELFFSLKSDPEKYPCKEPVDQRESMQKHTDKTHLGQTGKFYQSVVVTLTSAAASIAAGSANSHEQHGKQSCAGRSRTMGLTEMLILTPSQTQQPH